MKRIEDMTQAEVGAYVQTHLRKKGLDVVLSGGASAGVYTSGRYVSKDLDMIRGFSSTRKKLKPAMMEIGFEEQLTGLFKHPDSVQLIDFQPGPVMVGGEVADQVVEIKYSTGTLRVISATDCVKDRLAAYFHYDDRQGLAQAV